MWALWPFVDIFLDGESETVELRSFSSFSLGQFMKEIRITLADHW
jgi:hypothetical protein